MLPQETENHHSPGEAWGAEFRNDRDRDSGPPTTGAKWEVWGAAFRNDREETSGRRPRGCLFRMAKSDSFLASGD
jgi:hypothetical protein